MFAGVIMDWIWEKIVGAIIQGVPARIAAVLAMIPCTRPLADRLKESLERKILIGLWSVEKEGKKYITRWRFYKDNEVIVTSTGYVDAGRWQFKDECVHITWPSFIPPENREHCWETFIRPIKPKDVHGDSWQGNRCVRANKVK